MAVTAGFDFGGTRIKFGLVDDRGGVLFKDQAETPQGIGDFLAGFAPFWSELKKRSPEPVLAAGFGFPGIYDPSRKRVLQSPDCAGLDGFDLEPALARSLDVPFVIDNDANMAAYGEWSHGAGQGASSLVVVTIGTGIGGGIILDGRIWTGRNGFAGEIGHISVRPDGYACTCGNRGCLETEVAAAAVVRKYRTLSRDEGELTAQDVCRRAEAGDPAAKKSFALAGFYLGLGLGILVNLFNPEKILLGGGVMEAGEHLLRPAVEEAARRSFKASFEACTIAKAALGNDAGFIGAAARALAEARGPA